jgi:hypothetical protein
MAIWAVLAAPLLMSNKLKEIRPEFKEILQNKEVIKINQDALGIQGHRVFKVCYFLSNLHRLINMNTFILGQRYRYLDQTN